MQHATTPLSLAIMGLCAFGAAMNCGCQPNSPKASPGSVTSSPSERSGSGTDATSNGDRLDDHKKLIKPFVTGIAKSKAVLVYEGLPHKELESDLWAKELKEKKVIKFHDFHFYEGVLTLTEENATQFSSLFSQEKTFERYDGKKVWGPFEPDWSVAFADGDDVYEVLVCFGCEEARLFGPKNEVFSDLDGAALKKLVAVLAPLRKNRPKSKLEPRK